MTPPPPPSSSSSSSSSSLNPQFSTRIVLSVYVRAIAIDNCAMPPLPIALLDMLICRKPQLHVMYEEEEENGDDDDD
jgi:hypothetical protein